MSIDTNVHEGAGVCIDVSIDTWVPLVSLSTGMSMDRNSWRSCVYRHKRAQGCRRVYRRVYRQTPGLTHVYRHAELTHVYGHQTVYGHELIHVYGHER